MGHETKTRLLKGTVIMIDRLLASSIALVVLLATTTTPARSAHPAHDAPAHDAPAHDGPANDAPANDAPAHDGPAHAPAYDAAAHGLAADASPPDGPGGALPSLRAVRIAGGAPPVVASLDHPAWAGAPVATGFVQLRPSPGAAATQRTEARVLYDDEALYVGMRLFDADPSGIAAQLARRDATGIYSDWAHVLVDSYHDRRTAFRFSVNPVGVQRDVLHFDDYDEDVSWDAVWEAATAVDDDGWVAVFRIPLSQLRFSPNGGGEMVWGINFGREIAREAELAWWAPVLPDVPGMVSVAGELRGIRELAPPRRLEVLPYVMGRAEHDPAAAGNPFRRASGREGHYAVGGDLQYGLTSDLTLSATINPDFGQVEADPSVVNLTANETFYPERRPFFVEGANIFGYNIGFNDGAGEGLFYSRRIGRAPQRSVGSYGRYADVPGAATILGAAKLSGRTAGGWSLGLLDAVTAREVAPVLTTGDSIGSYVVEPLTNYAVARASRDFRRGRSGVGFIATSTHRRLEGDPGLAFLPDRAYTGGVDFRHRFAGDAWSLNGWLAGSHVMGDTVALQRLQRSPLRYMQRPDAPHVEYDPAATSMAGYGGTLNLFRVAGTWRGGVGGTIRSPGLEVNDVGYQYEADLRLVYGNLRYHRFEPVGPFRSFMVGINPSASWSFGGEHSHGQLNAFSNATLLNNWSGGISGGRSFQGLARGALRGGPAIVRPGGWWFNPYLNTDSRRPVRFSGWANLSRQDEGSGWQRGGGGTVAWRPAGWLDLRASPSLSERKSQWQYVAQPQDAGGGRHYLFASIHQRTVSVTTRADVTVTPSLSLQFYAQPFISAGDYSGFRLVTDPRAAGFDQRFHVLAGDEIRFTPGHEPGAAGSYAVDLTGDGSADFSFRQPDFNFKELRSNLVLRWEYRPGSTLFLVWSHGRSHADTGAFHLLDDLDRLLGARGRNTVAIKLNYWLDF